MAYKHVPTNDASGSIYDDKHQDHDQDQDPEDDDVEHNTQTRQQPKPLPQPRDIYAHEPYLLECEQDERTSVVRWVLFRHSVLLVATVSIVFVVLSVIPVVDVAEKNSWIFALALFLIVVVAIAYAKCHYHRMAPSAQMMALFFTFCIIVFGILIWSVFFRTSTPLFALLCSAGEIFTLFLFTLQSWVELNRNYAIAYEVVLGVVAFILNLTLQDPNYIHNLNSTNFWLLPPATVLGRLLVIFLATSYTIYFTWTLFFLIERCKPGQHWFMSFRLYVHIAYLALLSGFATADAPGLPHPAAPSSAASSDVTVSPQRMSTTTTLRDAVAVAR